MTTQNLSLFKALGAKMDYLSQRQSLIAQNVANSDTPGYRPQDLVPVDFGSVLKNIVQQGSGSVSLASTNSQHMPAPGQIRDPKQTEEKDIYEVTPTGNAVVMEEQLLNAGQTITDYNLMTSLYQKHVRMIQIALGTSR